MSKQRPGYSPEVRERAVRLVLSSEHEHNSRWAAIQSIASKIGCTPETLRSWINKAEVQQTETVMLRDVCLNQEKVALSAGWGDRDWAL